MSAFAADTALTLATVSQPVRRLSELLAPGAPLSSFCRAFGLEAVTPDKERD